MNPFDFVAHLSVATPLFIIHLNFVSAGKKAKICVVIPDEGWTWPYHPLQASAETNWTEPNWTATNWAKSQAIPIGPEAAFGAGRFSLAIYLAPSAFVDFAPAIGPQCTLLSRFA